MAYILGCKEPSSVYLLADLDWDKRNDKVETLLALKEEGYSRLYAPEQGQLRIDDVVRDAESGNYPAGLLLMVDRMKLPAMNNSLPVMPDARKCRRMSGKTCAQDFILRLRHVSAEETGQCS